MCSPQLSEGNICAAGETQNMQQKKKKCLRVFKYAVALREKVASSVVRGTLLNNNAYLSLFLSLSLLYSHPRIHCKWSPLFTAAGPLTCSSWFFFFFHRDKERNGLMPQLPCSRVCKVSQPPATAGGSPLHRSAWSHRRMEMSPSHTHTHTHRDTTQAVTRT